MFIGSGTMRQTRTAFAATIVAFAFCATAPGAQQHPTLVAQIAPGGQPAAPGTGAPSSPPGTQRTGPATSGPPAAPVPGLSPQPAQAPTPAQPRQVPGMTREPVPPPPGMTREPVPPLPGMTRQAVPPPPSYSEQALPPGAVEQPSTEKPRLRRRSAHVRRYAAIRIPRACRSVMFPRDPACGLHLPVTYGPYYYAPYPGYSAVYILCNRRGACR
jgi:hypothetical protein